MHTNTAIKEKPGLCAVFIGMLCGTLNNIEKLQTLMGRGDRKRYEGL